MITCTRRLLFCAGHRVYGHENKCAQPHGHQYVAYITVQMNGVQEVDHIGRVVDFACIKERIGEWIDKAWDHGFILWDKDLEMISAIGSVRGAKVYQMPYNPTAENMAAYLLDHVCPDLLLGTNCSAIKVVIQETENCTAEANRENLRH